MDWFAKQCTDALYTDLTGDQYLACDKYMSLYFHLEREPKINELKVHLNKKNIDFVLKYFENSEDFFIDQITAKNKKRKYDRERASEKRENIKDVVNDTNTSRET